MVATSISYFLFVILLATIVITILPSFNLLSMVKGQDDGGDGGDDNEGDDNEGDDNEGDDNEGDDNEGDDNEGDDNEGDDNEGDDNEGDDNEGDDNEGDDNGEGNIDITTFFGNGDTGDTDGDTGDTDGDTGDTDGDTGDTDGDIRLAFSPGDIVEGEGVPGAIVEGEGVPGAMVAGEGVPGAIVEGDPVDNSDTPNKDKTSKESSQLGSAGYASATEEESIPVPSQRPQFTHITKLIAEDLKKMPMEEIRTYPWKELGDKDVELVIKYLSYEPKFLGKILVNTPEDVISKFQNSISLKTFNEIIANMPPEQVQLIKDKLS